MSLEAEEKAFQAEVEAVKAWWKDDRWRQTIRPYTAEAIVSKRGNLPVQYPSNAQSKKLWKILESRFANGEVSATYGCLDPVMVTQMAKYLDTVYVSGWQCSSTASTSHEPSPDLADYPMVSFASFAVLTVFWHETTASGIKILIVLGRLSRSRLGWGYFGL
jgi:isocitrate lyase